MTARRAPGGSAPARRQVAIVYRMLPHYRLAFYDGLRSALASDGVDLRLLVGDPDPRQAARADTADLPWAEHIRQRHVRIGRRVLVWQPVLRAVRRCDLVIVEQASRLLVNNLLALGRHLGGPRLALWGHGRNLDPDTTSAVGERWKRGMVRRCDWWFAYTCSTVALVVGEGFPPDRVTEVRNATDTTALSQARPALDAGTAAQVRAELGLGDGDVAIYVGSLYPAKRIDFLLDAATAIRARRPGFQLLVVGDGPDRPLVDQAAATAPWIHRLGVRTGADLARVASVAEVLLMPGLVGLAVLDAFALEVPMVTTDVSNHSPEIDYLEDGVNGVKLPGGASPDDYAARVIALLDDPAEREQLRAGCRAGAAEYTVEAMVERFRAGILAALDSGRFR